MKVKHALYGTVLIVVAGLVYGIPLGASAASCTLTASPTTVVRGQPVTFTAMVSGYRGKAVRLYQSDVKPWKLIKTFTRSAPTTFVGTHTIASTTQTHTYRLAVADANNSGRILCAQSITVTVVEPSVGSQCIPTALASSSAQALGISPWYQKICTENGVRIVSSGAVADAALIEAGRIIRGMIGGRPSVAQGLIESGTRVAIIGENEDVLEIPEYRNLESLFPDVDYSYVRGLGATPFIPVSSASEENLLCYADDPYQEENVHVHEFAHSVFNMAATTSFRERVQEAYVRALQQGLWSETYARTNVDEYWAEGVQSHFNANAQRNPPDGLHNHVNTRAELAAYDPLLAGLITEYFGTTTFAYACP